MTENHNKRTSKIKISRVFNSNNLTTKSHDIKNNRTGNARRARRAVVIRNRRILICSVCIILVISLCISLFACKGKDADSGSSQKSSGISSDSENKTADSDNDEGNSSSCNNADSGSNDDTAGGDILSSDIGIVYNSDGTVDFNTPYYLADVDLESDADNLLDTDEAPAMYYGYSEFFGPWIYSFYALDDKSNYEYHDVGDGYVPQAGDLILTGDVDTDYYYLESSVDISGLRTFPYWHGCETWNGHILYVASVDEDGNMVCYEGNSIAPYQDLDVDDDDFIDKSSVDCIVMNFYDDTTVTEGKYAEKPIRVVIQTNYSQSAVNLINNAAYETLVAFNEDPESVRSDIQYLYDIADIDWCGLFVHYILLQALPEAELYESSEPESAEFETRPEPEFGGGPGRR